MIVAQGVVPSPATIFPLATSVGRIFVLVNLASCMTVCITAEISRFIEKPRSKRSAVVSKTKKAKISKDDFEDQIVVSVCGLAYSIVY